MQLTSWSTSSLILYIVLGFICFLSCFYAKRRERITEIKRRVANIEYLPWILSWIIVAAFRKVNSNVGGTDAPDYIQYFEHSLEIESDNTDIVFRIFNILIRSFTSDYHVYFIIYYGILIFSFILFINQFARKDSSSIPLCILFFLFLRSFTSMRSNLAIAFVLLAIVYLRKNNLFKTLIFCILAIFTHVSSFVYVAFVIFYYLYRRKKLEL